MDRAEDIVQIRKYLNGELNTHAMHALERRALDDPFLADALEGFEHASAGQKDNLAELTDRLHQRAEKKTRKIIPWIPLSAAASITIVVGAAIWFFTGKQSENEPKRVVAQNVAPEKKEVPTSATPSASTDTLMNERGNKVVQTEVAKPKADKEVYTKPKIAAQAPKQNELSEPAGNADQSVAEYKSPMGVVAPATSDAGNDDKYRSPQKDSIGANELLVGDIAKKKANNSPAFKPKLPPSTQTLLKSRVDGVNVSPNDGRTVTGTVMGNDGLPITGATVRVVGRNFGAVTDANGSFVLSDVSKGQTLSVNYLGYSGKKVKADRDSMRISLDPAGSSLSEVVVKRNENNTPGQDAHPRDGWKSFNDYLEKNAQSVDGEAGKVKVSFTVAADGTLNQFKIVKSLSDGADKKAISLISTGPAWTGNADGKAKEMTVTVKFH